MSTVENTVFISYRRSTSFFIARAMFMDLRAYGYSVFMDIESNYTGEFEGIILRQIAARAHFLMIIAPGTLERCQNPEDWMRRELEEAIRLKRNIIPILVNDFRFKDEEHYLTRTLAVLPKYNALTLPHEYFDAAMDKLRTRFLKVPVQVSVMVTPKQDEWTVQQKISEGASKSLRDAFNFIMDQFLSAAYIKQEQGDFQGAINELIEAIRLDPQCAYAYYCRGNAKYALTDYQGAVADYTEAIHINPYHIEAYNNRGSAKYELRDHQGAIDDYTEAVRINPQYAAAYYNRGNIKKDLGDYQGAITDYTKAILLNPQYIAAYGHRGISRYNLQDYQGAIDDYTDTLNFNPQDAYIYNNRGAAWENLGEYQKALADYEAALRIKPDYEFARKNRDNLLKKMKK